MPAALPQNTNNPCGSELARDSNLSSNINIECDDFIASKLAPTLDRCYLHFCHQSWADVGQYPPLWAKTL